MFGRTSKSDVRSFPSNSTSMYFCIGLQTYYLSVCNISSKVEEEWSSRDEVSLALISFVPRMIEVVGEAATDVSKVEAT